MKKTSIIITMMILTLTGVVCAMELCTDPQPSNITCLLVTPTISCSVYNYSIINISGSVITYGNMSLFNYSLYKFNFTQQIGEYIIYLCDGTIREMKVGEGSEMLIALIIAILIIPILLLFFASSLEKYDIGENGEKVPNNWNYILRFIAFIFFVAFIPLIANISMKIAASTKYFATTQMVYKISFGFVIVFFCFLFIYLFYKGFKIIPFYREDKD
jgi:hypothetical protein